MEENKKINSEDIKFNLKGTIESFLETDVPELQQEDAIKLYKDENSNYSIKKKKNSDEEDENEDDEHLKRVKRELLESLERVKTLEKNIFSEKAKIKGLKIKEDSKSKDKSKVINQMRQKIQEDKGRSREE